MLFLVFICDEKHSADWLTAFATPYPASRDFLHGKASHLVLRSLCSPTNQVRLPPYSGGRIGLSMFSHSIMQHTAEYP